MANTNYLDYPATQVKSFRLRSSTPESFSEDLANSDTDTDESVPVVVRRITWQSSLSRCAFPTHSFQSKSDHVYKHFENPATKIDKPVTKILETTPVREKLITWQNLSTLQKHRTYSPVNNYSLAAENCATPATETNQSSSTKVLDRTDTRERPITGHNSSIQQIPMMYSSLDSHHYIYEERTDNTTRNVWVFLFVFIIIVGGLLFMVIPRRPT